jgi:hypothetical protein
MAITNTKQDWGIGSVVYRCTHEYVMQIQETMVQHRAGLITLDNMYERLVGLQGNICEALQFQNQWEAEHIQHEKLRRLCYMTRLTHEERQNSLS